MKLKHFAGYGCINAKKISKTTTTNIFGEKFSILKIQVKGAHEQGLETDDTYRLYNWLVKRFDKSVKDERDIVNVKSDNHFTDEYDEYMCHVEECIYTFTIKQNNK